MFSNYFKTAWRSISRYKTYSIINVLGLALGIATCMIIFLIVKYELGYDSFQKKADRTYRVTLNAIDFNPSVSLAIAKPMQSYFPEIEQITQVDHRSNGIVSIGNQRYVEKNYMYADSAFTRIFDYKWVRGDANTALADPNSIVLTETIARKYFGNADAMGKILTLDKDYTLKVTGIIKDIPGNTVLPFDFLVSFKTIWNEVKDQTKYFYAISGTHTFILLPPNVSVAKIQKRIPDFIAFAWGKDMAKEARLPLQPLRDIHFDQRYLNSDITPTTSRETYFGLSAIAVFVLLIACINFINLATAQATRRAKEIGVRKVLGSSRSQLITQFLSETTMMVIVGVLLGIAATALFLPQLSVWLNVKLGTAELFQPASLLLEAGIAVAMIFIAGLYPAFIQSALQPVVSLKSQASSGGRVFPLRKALVVVQFAISQAMIIGTLVVAYQMDFFKNRDLGFNKDAVISFYLPDVSKRPIIRDQLLSNPGVQAVSFASGPPVYNANYGSLSAPELGITKDDVTELKFIDENYTSMFGLHMLAGKSIYKREEKDTAFNVVVNEALLGKLLINDPEKAIGKHIMASGQQCTIMGVVQDFQSESKHKKRRPCVMFYGANNFFNASVKLKPVAMTQTIAAIGKGWSATFPGELFQYEFLDDHIANWYRQEEKEYTAFKLFSGIAILIGCLGLYGLVAFAAAQRVKEVGVRKVLGASLGSILMLFSKEFIVLILIAFVVAAPLAWLAMNSWLENFAYRIQINWILFAIALGSSFAIAALTIGYQAFKAARVNPVRSLRAE